MKDFYYENGEGEFEKNVIVEKCHEEKYEKLMKKLSSAAQQKRSHQKLFGGRL